MREKTEDHKREGEFVRSKINKTKPKLGLNAMNEEIIPLITL